MSVGLPSDEVAEDYKNSLEDLAMNSRYEISNLTVIAKENVDHAMAISRVLENHIKNIPPDRKLPALYVLDSVVKNVGTPYTLFLGRNLYNIFMSAYSLVNSAVRRKLDEMLKTWKEPVPGSLDPRPVFSADVTRPIESALLKAKTAAIQQNSHQQFRDQQEMMGRGRPMGTPNTGWRNTPTPPQANGHYRPPQPQGYPPQGYPVPNMPNGQYQTRSPFIQYPQHPAPQATPIPYQQPYQNPLSYQQQPPTMGHLDSLHRDIEDLIKTARTDFASNPYDSSIQSRLKALLDLQTILKQQQLPPYQLQQVRDQVTALSTVSRPAPTPAPRHDPPPHQQPPPSQPAPAQPPAFQTPDLQTLLSSGNLADIIARANRAPSTPPVSQVPPSHTESQSQPSSSIPASSLANGSSSLLASLRAAGMVPADSTTPRNGSYLGAQPSYPYATAPNQFTGLVPPSLINDVQLTSASLKMPRPHLISTLYEAKPNQCTTCGRRFLASEEGREKKARHLDWHFRTNQRLADSAKHGQSRSWYVNELEWIQARDSPDPSPSDPSSTNPARKAALAASLAAADPRNKYIISPSDSTLTNLPCPVCQEKFNTVWNDELQEFVWMDAINIGSRVYHASCHSELKPEGAITPTLGRTSTPDSVLGKRKAIGYMSPVNAKAIKI